MARGRAGRFVGAVERQLLELVRGNPVRLAVLMTATLVAYASMAAEAWIILYAAGVPVSFTGALAVETFSRVASFASAFIPANLGALEASSLAAVTAVGAVGAGAPLALARRLRGLFWAGVGLAIYPRGQTVRPSAGCRTPVDRPRVPRARSCSTCRRIPRSASRRSRASRACRSRSACSVRPSARATLASWSSCDGHARAGAAHDWRGTSAGDIRDRHDARRVAERAGLRCPRTRLVDRDRRRDRRLARPARGRRGAGSDPDATAGVDPARFPLGRRAGGPRLAGDGARQRCRSTTPCDVERARRVAAGADRRAGRAPLGSVTCRTGRGRLVAAHRRAGRRRAGRADDPPLELQGNRQQARALQSADLAADQHRAHPHAADGQPVVGGAGRASGFYSAWLFSLGHYWTGVLGAFLVARGERAGRLRRRDRAAQVPGVGARLLDRDLRRLLVLPGDLRRD